MTTDGPCGPPTHTHHIHLLLTSTLHIFPPGCYYTFPLMDLSDRACCVVTAVGSDGCSVCRWVLRPYRDRSVLFVDGGLRLERTHTLPAPTRTHHRACGFPLPCLPDATTTAYRRTPATPGRHVSPPPHHHARLPPRTTLCVGAFPHHHAHAPRHCRCRTTLVFSCMPRLAHFTHTPPPHRRPTQLVAHLYHQHLYGCSSFTALPGLPIP